MHAPALDTIAFVGSYIPRRCGIATFTHDLRAAVAAHLPRAACPVVALHPPSQTGGYPAEVRFECPADDRAAYAAAADFLGLVNVDVVSIQHEYGIFGGPSGGHVLALLENLRAPVHTTLHTVLATPSSEQRAVLREVIRLSARIVVMSDRGRDLLRGLYGVAAERIDVIPHGIPDVPWSDPGVHKEACGLAGADVLLTFGLLSPNKGIETAITALPEIVARHPRTRYVVLGATHPELLRTEGERYRESLVRLAADRGVAEHVVFHDRYVELPELLAFLRAADVYVTPYLGADQITSGTLAYAFGSGAAIISTPYWHARELLADGRGVLVPFRDPAALAHAACRLLADTTGRRHLRRRNWLLGRDMLWSRAADRYAESFRRARLGLAVRRRSTATPPRDEPAAAAVPDSSPGRLPPLRLSHLWRLTDSCGVLQHAAHDVPDREHGYCTDDNARALTLMVQLESLGLDTPQTRRAAARYAAFLGHAFVPATGRFRNFLSFDRRWLDDRGTDDCLGRAVLALGTCIGRSRRPETARWAMRSFAAAATAVTRTTSPRAWAHAILAIGEYLHRLGGDRHVTAIRAALVARLVELQRSTAGPAWPWCEDVVTYDNGRLCQALIAGGRSLGDGPALETGLAMLDWLVRIQCSDTGRFSPIGCNGFLRRGAEPATFDQQPLESCAMVAACTAAFRATAESRWLDHAWLAFDWFLGRNVLGIAVCDPRTGACRDGLHEDRTNENRGAESTLAYLAAVVELQGVEAEVGARPRAAEAPHGRPAGSPP
jgi:glycosyltransferase involved in cell wall biosynthesis